MIKKLISFLAIFFLGAGGLAGASWAYASRILARGTERAVSYALQVDVRVGNISLRPIKGQFELGDLEIGNPEGYNTRSAFRVRRAVITADLQSLLGDTPTIQLIEITDPKVTLERSLRTSNLRELIANASRFQRPGAEDQPEEIPADAPEGARKRLKIDKVLINGAEVALSAPILQGQEVVFPLTRIEMEEIGGEKERVGLAEFLKLLIDRILTTAVVQGAGIMPEGFDVFGEAGGRLLEGAQQGLKTLLGRD